MYIPQFWCGVIATLVIEFAVILIWGIYNNFKKEKNDGSEKEK